MNFIENEQKNTQDVLYIRFSIDHSEPETHPHTITSDTTNPRNINALSVKIETILKIANSIIKRNRIKSNKFMNVFVQIEKKFVNIFQFKRSNTLTIRREDKQFYLNVSIQSSSNALQQFTLQKRNYGTIMQKLNKINQIFYKEVETLNDQQRRSFDIAYFFAEPLVQPSQIDDFPMKIKQYGSLNFNQISSCGTDVSFQKEYDKFIKVLGSQQSYFSISIKIMVATESNIKQILNLRCNILHFSCHGVKDFLKIQRDGNNVGYLDVLTLQKLIKLLEDKVLPRMIIFNVCFSSQIAKQINKKFPSIITIGYQKEALDDHCQLLTQKIYQGIYKNKQPISKIFEDIKRQISKKNQKKANQMVIFRNKYSKQYTFENKNKTNGKWNKELQQLQNLRDKEPIGIKKQLYHFIKDYFMNYQKLIVCVVGETRVGKATFIQKAISYSIHRNIFQKKIQINCWAGQTKIVNMLMLKLKYKKDILKKIIQFKDKNLILVINHCNDLIRNQAEEFFNFLKRLKQKHIKMGKILISSDFSDQLFSPNAEKTLKKYFYQEPTLKMSDNTPNPRVIKQLDTYLKRWHPQVKYQPYLCNYRLPTLMRALEKVTKKEEFINNLKVLEQEQQKRQQEKVLIDLQDEFKKLQYKIVTIQRKMRIYIESGYYSRNQDQFILLEIFPQFPHLSNTRIPETQQNQNQRKSKIALEQEITTIYDAEIKNIIETFTINLGKFRQSKWTQAQKQKQFLNITQKLFIIVGLAVLIKRPEQVEAQLFNSYTFVSRLIDFQNKLLSQLPRLMALCQAIKLKIYVALYNFYKNQYIYSYKERFETNLGYYQNILQNLKEIDILKESSQSIHRTNEYNSINLRESVQFRGSYIRQSITRNRRSSTYAISAIRDSENRQIHLSSLRNQSVQKELHFVQFQKEFKQTFYHSEYWELVERVMQMDTIIRKMKIQQPSLFPQNNSQNSLYSLAQSSTYERLGSVQIYFTSIQRFYDLYQKIHHLYDRCLTSQKDHQDQQDFIQQLAVKKLFFSQNQLDLVYLQGLKLIEKLFVYIEKQYLFDYEQKYHEKLKFIKGKLIQSQRILNHKIFQKIRNNDYSYKKIYKDYLEKYIDVRFKLQKLKTSSGQSNQKQQLSIFSKLLRLSQQGKFSQQKNKIEEYIEKSFYNKCSILISQPLGYFRNSYKNDRKIEKKHSNNMIKQKDGKKGKKQKQNKSNYHSKQNQQIQNARQNERQNESQNKIHFFPLNIFRNSSLILNQMKQSCQQQVFNQIHIQIQTLTYEKLICSKKMKHTNQDEIKQVDYEKIKKVNNQDIKKISPDIKSKQRLIYLIFADCKQTDNHQSIFLQNQYGQSIKYDINDLFKDQSVSFPIAPVIIFYGSNVQAMYSYYRRKYQKQIKDNKKQEKKIAFIKFLTINKLPEIKGQIKGERKDKDQIIRKYIWNQYIEKQIGLNLLSSFWITFCQVYFDQEHESFQNQIIRSFNIAKQKSIIITKKKYCEGLSRSQVQKQIDKIAKNLTFQFINVNKNDPPISLRNSCKKKTKRNLECSQFFTQNQDEPCKNHSERQISIIKNEQEIYDIFNHQIGNNLLIYAFLKQFYQNIKLFEENNEFCSTWIKYKPQINQSNAFVKTIYHKLLRFGNRFQFGVEIKNMANITSMQNQFTHIFQESLGISNQFFNYNRMGYSERLGQSLEYQQSNIFLGNSCMNRNRKKKVEIYYNVRQEDILKLIRSFVSTDEAVLQNSLFDHLSHDKNQGTVFRIVLVNTKMLSQQGIQYFNQQKCQFEVFSQKPNQIENLYHSSDTIFTYSKKIEDFSFEKIFKILYPSKPSLQQLKSSSSREVKDKAIQFLHKYLAKNNQSHH